MMKSQTKFTIGVVSVCLSLVLVNCGGGGSSSSDGSPSGGSGKLTQQSTDTFAARISKEAGCEYTKKSGTQSAVMRIGLMAIGRAGSTAVSEVKALNPAAGKTEARSSDCQTQDGSCGGTMTMCSTSSSYNIDMSNYCSEDYGGVRSTLDGKLTIGITQQSNGTKIYTASTSSFNVKSSNPNTHENVDVTLSLSNGKVVRSDSSCEMQITASSIEAKDNIAHETYRVKNVDVAVNDQCSATIQADYSDSQIGSVHISGTSDQNGKTSLTVTDSEGSKVTIDAPTDSKVLDVKMNGQEVGTMDCSSVDTSAFGGFIGQE